MQEMSTFELFGLLALRVTDCPAAKELPVVDCDCECREITSDATDDASVSLLCVASSGLESRRNQSQRRHAIVDFLDCL